MPPIKELKRALKAINPGGETGDCTLCAVEAAEVLTTDRDARPASIRLENANHNDKICMKLGDVTDRATVIRNWLLSADTRCGVYAVDAGEDHAYNFVKTTAGRLYVVDSNLHVYLRVNPQQADSSIEDKYNYFDPPDDEEGNQVTIYYWGALGPAWNDKLNTDD